MPGIRDKQMTNLEHITSLRCQARIKNRENVLKKKIIVIVLTAKTRMRK